VIEIKGRQTSVLRPLYLCLLAGAVGMVAVVSLVQALAAGQQVAGGRIEGTQHTPPAPHLGYGLNLRDPAHLDTLYAPLGFEWVKLYEQYDARPDERLPYKVLYRIQLDGPPADLATWGDHVEALAQAGLGLVEAYEIGNEPNQSWQWGNQVPDPDAYVVALKVAYARIKAVDPGAIVVSGGLGPVGRIQATPAGEGKPGNNGAAMDEWEYAHAMFSQCRSGCFDVFGYHPFGFAYPPETDPASVSNNFAFRGAEDLRQIMRDHGLGDTPMWATEFGWIRDPDADGYGWCKLVPDFNDHFGWMLVSELEQADYLSRAFAYADAHWPWMEALFVWNLDWNDQGWDCDHVRFFSLRHVDGSATLAYAALAAMPRRPGPVSYQFWAEPTSFTWLTCPGGLCRGGTLRYPTLLTGVVSLNGLDRPGGVTWTATLLPSSTLQPTLAVTQGRLGDRLTLTVDSGAYLTTGTGTLLLYPTGTYTAVLVLTTTPRDLIGNPQRVRVKLIVAPELYRLYLPVTVTGP
jgi:hypothetical protein